MSGLVLKLAPKERVLVNGAVIENGDRRSKISIISQNANILRLKDAIHPQHANTPVKRACLLAQLILSGETEIESASLRLASQIGALYYAFQDAHSNDTLTMAAENLKRGNVYACLKGLRQLMAQEARMISGIGE